MKEHKMVMIVNSEDEEFGAFFYPIHTTAELIETITQGSWTSIIADHFMFTRGKNLTEIVLEIHGHQNVDEDMIDEVSKKILVKKRRVVQYKDERKK